MRLDHIPIREESHALGGGMIGARPPRLREVYALTCYDCASMIETDAAVADDVGAATCVCGARLKIQWRTAARG